MCSHCLVFRHNEINCKSISISKSHGSEKSEDEMPPTDTVWERVNKRRTTSKAYGKTHSGDKIWKKVESGYDNKLKSSSLSKLKFMNEENLGVLKPVMTQMNIGTKNEGKVSSQLPEKRAHPKFRVGAFGNQVE
ncbi:hypothetical protein U1Q18_049145 [Sarracenia purpurea var. burkii]